MPPTERIAIRLASPRGYLNIKPVRQILSSLMLRTTTRRELIAPVSREAQRVGRIVSDALVDGVHRQYVRI
jgi:hypothetical protein